MSPSAFVLWNTAQWRKGMDCCQHTGEACRELFRVKRAVTNFAAIHIVFLNDKGREMGGRSVVSRG